MSKKGDDVKTLFAHLGLDPEDYRELHEEGGGEDSAGDRQAPDQDNWPHLEDSGPQTRRPDVDPEPQQQPEPAQPPRVAASPSVPPRLSDDEDTGKADRGRQAPHYADDDLIDDVLDDAVAKQQHGTDDPGETAPDPEPELPDREPQPPAEQTPARSSAAPAALEPQLPERGVEAGPERWSLLSSFDDIAGDTPEAEIEGLDDPTEFDAPQPAPRQAQSATDDTASGFVARAKRLLRSDEDADAGARRAERSEPSRESADDFWDEVAPQGQGDVDIDAVLARAEQTEDASSENDHGRDTPDEVYSEPELPRQGKPIEAAERDSALGGVMARLRAGPGPRPETKSRLNLALDAPRREPVRDETPRDADLASVLQRLKSTRRG